MFDLVLTWHYIPAHPRQVRFMLIIRSRTIGTDVGISFTRSNEQVRIDVVQLGCCIGLDATKRILRIGSSIVSG